MNANSPLIESQLSSRLKRIFDDKEFIMGMLVFAYDDEDRQFLIDYIDAGDDVNIETVSVLALNLCDRRDEINANRKSRLACGFLYLRR